MYEVFRTSRCNCKKAVNKQKFFNVPMIDSSHIREKIKSYLKLESRLERAATKVFNGEKNIEEVVQTYGLEPSLLKFKIDIMQGKEHYWKVKDKIEEAVKHIVFFSEIKFDDILIEIAARKFGVNETVLTDECNKYERLNDKTLYEYEELSANMEGDFTYKEEFFLLQQLLFLMKNNLRGCPCKVCVLECFGSLAFELAKHYTKQYYSEWSKHENSNLKWLSLFMIGYTKEISTFKFSNFCTVQPQA